MASKERPSKNDETPQERHNLYIACAACLPHAFMHSFRYYQSAAPFQTMQPRKIPPDPLSVPLSQDSLAPQSAWKVKVNSSMADSMEQA